MEIPYERIKQSIELPNRERVVVYFIDSAKREMPRRELLRNVFKVTRDGTPIWRIQLPNLEDARAFLEVYIAADGRLIAYNADSWEYEVDVASGNAKPHAFLK